MGYRKSVFQTFTLITQLSLCMLAPVFLCVFLGSYLQNKYEWSVFIPLLIFGMLAGVRNSYLLIKHTLRCDEEEAKKNKRY
ncbi:MAG: AtpZ/AtpI family protein [Eubacteriales bacterium]